MVEGDQYDFDTISIFRVRAKFGCPTLNLKLKNYDANGDKLITAKELQIWMFKHGKTLSTADLKSIVKGKEYIYKRQKDFKVIIKALT